MVLLCWNEAGCISTPFCGAVHLSRQHVDPAGSVCLLQAQLILARLRHLELRPVGADHLRGRRYSYAVSEAVRYQ